MKKELIVDLIEKLINNEPYDLELLDNASSKTSVEEFLLNTAYRLVNTYARYNEGKCGTADYLVAIRGFMLTSGSVTRRNLFHPTIIFLQFLLPHCCSHSAQH